MKNLTCSIFLPQIDWWGLRKKKKNPLSIKLEASEFSNFKQAHGSLQLL